MPNLKKFLLLTASHEGSPIAYHAKREGLDVLVGVIQDWSETYTPEELKEDKQKEELLEKDRRTKIYHGMVPEVTPQKLLSVLDKMSLSDKGESFVMTDMNLVSKYSSQAVDKQVPGNFPLVEDRILEADREKGKEFVKEYYTDLKLSEVHDFNKVQDALDFLEENMANGDQAKLWVLKANDGLAETIVPLNTDTPEQAYQTIKTALEKDVQLYEGKGFILEEFIRDAIELTPQCVFYNGEPVYYCVDIEIKKRGSGLSGRTTGCAANVVFRTRPNDKINKMAFPPIIYQMAKKRPGLFIWDASILCDPNTGDCYFGEFCCNRWGFDSTYTEITMGGGVTKYFNNVMGNQAPYDYGKFGFAVRMFNELDDPEIPKHAAPDVPFYVDRSVSEYVWPMDIYEDKDGMKTCGWGRELAVVTCVADTIEQAARGCYEYMEKISFKDYSRLSLDDVLSTQSAGTILNRFAYGNDHKLYEVSNNQQPIEKNINPISMEQPSQPLEFSLGAMPTTEISSMRGVLDMVTAVMNENDQLKKQFVQKVAQLEKNFQQKILEHSEQLRTEMSVKYTTPSEQLKQNKQVESLALQVGAIIQEFKTAVSAISSIGSSNQSVLLLQDNLKAIEQGLKPLQQASYWVKISDRLSTVETLLEEMVKYLKLPKQDAISPQLVRMFSDMQKTYTENTDRMIKANRETITVVSGGSNRNIPYVPTVLQVPASSRVTNTSPGTAKQITATSSKARRVAVAALITNSTVIYVGDSTTKATAGSEAGYPLLPGGGYEFEISDPSKVWFDVQTSGDGLTYIIIA